MSKYLVIAIVVLTAALAATGALLKSSWEANAAIKAHAEEQAAKYETAIAQQQEAIKDLEVQRALDQREILALGKEIARIEGERDELKANYDKWRSTLKARTLEKPKVVERAARIAIGSRMRRLYEATGGSNEESPN